MYYNKTRAFTGRDMYSLIHVRMLERKLANTDAKANCFAY